MVRVDTWLLGDNRCNVALCELIRWVARGKPRPQWAAVYQVILNKGILEDVELPKGWKQQMSKQSKKACLDSWKVGQSLGQLGEQQEWSYEHAEACVQQHPNPLMGGMPCEAWSAHIRDKTQAAAEAAGFSSHSAHSAAKWKKRGKGKESTLTKDRHVKRQAELNSISGGGWTISFVKATA